MCACVNSLWLNWQNKKVSTKAGQRSYKWEMSTERRQLDKKVKLFNSLSLLLKYNVS